MPLFDSSSRVRARRVTGVGNASIRCAVRGACSARPFGPSGASGRCLVWGGSASFPMTSAVLVEGLVEFVELVVAIDAHQGHLIDVGSAFEP